MTTWTIHSQKLHHAQTWMPKQKSPWSAWARKEKLQLIPNETLNPRALNLHIGMSFFHPKHQWNHFILKPWRYSKAHHIPHVSSQSLEPENILSLKGPMKIIESNSRLKKTSTQGPSAKRKTNSMGHDTELQWMSQRKIPETGTIPPKQQILQRRNY